MNILFVDKDKKLHEALYPLLAKKNNAEYRIAGNSQDAIKELKTDFQPDFLFVEYDCPPGNGMDVIMYLQTKPYASKVKIMMTTDLQDYKKIESIADMIGAMFERKPLQLYSMQRFITENWSLG